MTLPVCKVVSIMVNSPGNNVILTHYEKGNKMENPSDQECLSRKQVVCPIIYRGTKVSKS
jgi:hypothetical protein